MDSMNANDKIAIVTGGARGLGLAMVKGLLGNGVAVAAVDRDREPLEQLAAATKQDPHAAPLLTIVEDLTTAGAAERVGLRVLARFGRIDVLVNNAGMGQSVVWPNHWRELLRFWNIEPEQLQRFFNLNTHALFNMARMAVPHMMRQKWGRIINITTSLGTMVRAGFVPYGSSKAAAESMSAIMAAELTQTGVTVNVLTPGGLTNTAANPDAPFDRNEMLQPEIMVPPLLWLISDAASGVTGRRFVAVRWDSKLPGAEAAEQAGAPAGWTIDQKNEAIHPKRVG
jgi:NAD(P)-dependent dehydrogenase (short-subunit alcohol dehydrogenase family)